MKINKPNFSLKMFQFFLKCYRIVNTTPFKASGRENYKLDIVIHIDYGAYAVLPPQKFNRKHEIDQRNWLLQGN